MVLASLCSYLKCCHTPENPIRESKELVNVSSKCWTVKGLAMNRQASVQVL